MSTALAEREPTAPVVTADQLDLVKRTVAQGATDAELKLYLYDCARQGVHPLDRLLHFTKRGGKYTPVTSIDLMRTRAADTGEYAGSEDAAFHTELDERGRIDTTKPPISSTVSVYRLVQGQRCAFTATARWSEYFPGDAGGHMWKKMPHTMLAKCAEALALRKGFPRQLAGLYAKEELDQAETKSGYVVEAPAASVAGPTPAAARETVGASVPNADPSGHLHLVKVERVPTRKANVTKYVIVLSDGREVTTIKDQLGALAEQLTQDGDAVDIDTKDTQWGVDLVALRRANRAAPVDDVPPLTDADISF